MPGQTGVWEALQTEEKQIQKPESGKQQGEENESSRRGAVGCRRQKGRQVRSLARKPVANFGGLCMPHGHAISFRPRSPQLRGLL